MRETKRITEPSDSFESSALVKLLLQHLQSESKISVESVETLAGRIAAEIDRICHKSERIQSSGEVRSWKFSLALHRLKKCLNYYQLGSRKGRVELHSTLGSRIYRCLTPDNLELSFQARCNLMNDFLQGFYSESLKVFRRENELPNGYHPRTLLELGEYMAFTEQYAKRQITLPNGQRQQLIMLQAQKFGQRFVTKASIDSVQTVENFQSEESGITHQIGTQIFPDSMDSSNMASLQPQEISELLSYLETQRQNDCADYLILKLQNLPVSEMDEILGLTPRQRDYLQQRFKYYLERFTLLHDWELPLQSLNTNQEQNLDLLVPPRDHINPISPKQKFLFKRRRRKVGYRKTVRMLKFAVKGLKKVWKTFKRIWKNLPDLVRKAWDQLFSSNCEQALNPLFADQEISSINAPFLEQKHLSDWEHLQTQRDLPLLKLFIQLREAGLLLGMDEYFFVLRALQKGFGTADRDSLANLCRTLWVKSRDDEHLFNYHFEQVMQFIPSSTSPPPTEIDQELLPNLPEPSVSQEKLDEETDAEDLPTPTTSTAISQELMEVEDEIQVAEAVQIATRSDTEVVVNRFTQSDEYFPVTRRQMKQSWRHLRRMVREGPLVEIDIEATIARFSQQGIPSEPVLVPGRINRTELLLLLDHKGSMVPFHALAQRLAETAQRGGRLGEAGVFYFHNCPTQYLYRDPSRQQAELVSDLLMRLRPERSVVLIFSDGGAARGGFNPERVDLTNQFLNQLKERVRYVAWLNPMSKDRWAGTTAGEIAQRVPMFEMSRKGMEGAIDVLRGRSLQVVG